MASREQEFWAVMTKFGSLVMGSANMPAIYTDRDSARSVAEQFPRRRVIRVRVVEVKPRAKARKGAK